MERFYGKYFSTAIIHSLLVFRCGEGGHDTFTCQIIYMFKNQILAFSLIVREKILMICCVLISCHISRRLPARSWSENGMLQMK